MYLANSRQLFHIPGIRIDTIKWSQSTLCYRQARVENELRINLEPTTESRADGAGAKRRVEAKQPRL